MRAILVGECNAVVNIALHRYPLLRSAQARTKWYVGLMKGGIWLSHDRK